MYYKIDKNTLRKELLLKRNSLEIQYIESASTKIALFLLQSKEYQKFQNIGLYYSFGSEVKTLGLIETALSNTKYIGLPVIIDQEKMFFYHIKESNLNSVIFQKSRYGINEPDIKCHEVMDNIELLVVPGIGFDRQGNRLGYGKGYYDKFIDTFKPKFVMGLSFASQVIDDRFPVETNDRKINGLVTEKGIIYF